MSDEIKLASGSVLIVQVSPFATSKALYQAVLKELKSISFTSSTELAALYKDMFCVGFSSPEIESLLWECFKRCTLDGLKIDKDTFEPVERRDDYMQVCMEVAKANILPFTKSLMQLYSQFSTIIGSAQS